MIRWCIIFVTLVWTLALSGQGDDHRDFLPPYNFHVDSVSLLATWEPPKIILLEEDFEELPSFPPPGWTRSSLGKGWLGVESPGHWFWVVPEHPGFFALANDDSAGYSNNGSMDYLVTPEMDLTVADSFHLYFDFYFDGGYGEQAFVEYSTDGGASWQLLKQMDPELEWDRQEVDLSDFSGEVGESNFQLAFHADDNGYFASGWAIDNVVVYSGQNPHEVIGYKVFLDSEQIAQVNTTYYQYNFEFTSIQSCGVLARYQDGVSDTSWQTVRSDFFPAPESLSGFAPDYEAILEWDPPLVSWEERFPEDSRDFGDILQQFSAPIPISMCWGICDDGMDLWITDPNTSATSIYQVTYDGVMTGNIITVSQGQSWVGDMVSDGEYLYGCLVGGPNSIVRVEIATGETAGTIDGAWTVTAQRGLAADFINEEFYIGGWTSNQIWRITFDGTTISTFGFTGVSGLTWHSTGGPEAEGSLWVVTSAANSLVTELDPNGGWVTFQSFQMPGGEPFSGAGTEIKTNGANCGSLWICNRLENIIYLVDVEEPLAVPCSNPVSVPDNLIGFNIYRNSEYRATVNCTEPECCYYIDPIDFSEQTFFLYEVTALYDLSEYGFPADTGESLREGPAAVTSCCWNELEFFEDWSIWSHNYWKFSGDNWKVDSEIGNDAPAAVFQADSVLLQYKDTLQSYLFFTGTSMPIDIILEYDVSLSSVNPTGDEKLLIQVYDYFNGNWNTVKTHDNAAGSFGWQRDTLNITGAFNGDGFRIRFNAQGENSADINYWAIDNIAVRREFYPPENVRASFSPASVDSILVSWDDPLAEMAEWWEWDDGVHYNSIGYGCSKDDWHSAAVRWTPELLADLKDANLTAIGFISSEASAWFKVAVWTGEDKTLVYTQAAGYLVENEWKIISLDIPLNVDITKDLLVGYMFATGEGYPMSCDDGPAIDGFGNLMQMAINGDWLTLLEANPDLDYNWNIKAWFERDGYPAGSYRLFRSLDGNEPEMIAELEDTIYIDTVSSGYTTSCYKLKSVYYEEYESGFSEEACVIFTSSDPVELKKDGLLKIFPNPSDCSVSIESSENIEMISLYNSFGKLMLKKKVDDLKVEIPVSDFPAGVYMIRIETGKEVVSRKVMVVH